MGMRPAIRRYSGLRGLSYVLYLVWFGLEWTTLWFWGERIVSWVFRGRSRPSHEAYLKALMSYVDPRLVEIGRAPTEDGCIVLANHVNWSDFVIDMTLVPRPCLVSRNVLWYVFFPASMLRQLLFDDVIYFKRGTATARPQLYASVEAKVRQGRQVVIYPEGTRNPTAKRLPLKLGLVKLAYDRRIPVYVSMTHDKSEILDEHKKLVTLGMVVRNRKSNLVSPVDFDTLDQFLAAVQQEWDRLWDQLIDRPDAG